MTREEIIDLIKDDIEHFIYEVVREEVERVLSNREKDDE